MKRASSLRLSGPNPMIRPVAGLSGFSMVAIATSYLLPARGFVLGRPLDRCDDVLVARTPADRARYRGTDLVLGGVGVLVEQRPCGHQHSGCAEAAVQRVLLVEALLDRIEVTVDLERLNRADLVPLRHRRKHRARLHGL